MTEESLDVYVYNGQEVPENVLAVKISSTVTEIPDKAFADCEALKEVDLSQSSVEQIGARSFKGCVSLTTVKLGPNTKIIDYVAFGGCVNLKEIDLQAATHLEVIGDFAFIRCPSLVELHFPEKLAFIGARAFMDCGALKIVVFPPMLRVIGDSAFRGCHCLQNVDFSRAKQLESIVDDTFIYCDALRHVKLPPSISSIGRPFDLEIESIQYKGNNLEMLIGLAVCYPNAISLDRMLFLYSFQRSIDMDASTSIFDLLDIEKNSKLREIGRAYPEAIRRLLLWCVASSISICPS